MAHYGNLKVTSSTIPYGSQFNLPDTRETTIGDFMEEMDGDRGWEPGQFRRYVFEGDTILRRDVAGGDWAGFSFLDMDEVAFTSFQWYLGGTGSGAPIHFHSHAFNYIAYGRKHWFLIPPRDAVYSRKPVGRWLAEDLPALEAEGVPVHRCVQPAGTAFFAPHG